MDKRNRLVWVVCLSLSSLALFAVDPQTKFISVKESKVEMSPEPVPLENIKIKDAENLEIAKAESSKGRSIFEKCLLAIRGMGAGAVSLFCGACIVEQTRAGLRVIGPNARGSFLDKSYRGVGYLGAVTVLMLASYSVAEYGFDSFKAAIKSNS